MYYNQVLTTLCINQKFWSLLMFIKSCQACKIITLMFFLFLVDEVHNGKERCRKPAILEIGL